MPQNYASFPTHFFTLFTTLFINDVASHCEKKIKTAGENFFAVFMVLWGLGAGHPSVNHAFTTSVLKTQTSFLNHYLAYASSRGIGGGGGHGNGFI